MAKSKESFARRERERNKKFKADQKRERRLEKGEGDSSDEAGDQPVYDEAETLQAIADLNAEFDEGDMDFEDFEKRRDELLARLMV